MDPISIIEASKKHGISILLILALVWMNSRLSAVEEKLYDCLEDRATISQAPLSQKKYTYEHPVLAVLPEKLKIKCLS